MNIILIKVPYVSPSVKLWETFWPLEAPMKGVYFIMGSR